MPVACGLTFPESTSQGLTPGEPTNYISPHHPFLLWSTTSLAFHSSNSSGCWGLKEAKASRKKGEAIKRCLSPSQPPHLSQLMWLVLGPRFPRVPGSTPSLTPSPPCALPLGNISMAAPAAAGWESPPALSHLHSYELFLMTSSLQPTSKKSHHFTIISAKLAFRVHSS